jgi:hypothetical protein
MIGLGIIRIEHPDSIKEHDSLKPLRLQPAMQSHANVFRLQKIIAEQIVDCAKTDIDSINTERFIKIAAINTLHF